MQRICGLFRFGGRSAKLSTTPLNGIAQSNAGVNAVFERLGTIEESWIDRTLETLVRHGLRGNAITLKLEGAAI